MVEDIGNTPSGPATRGQALDVAIGFLAPYLTAAASLMLAADRVDMALVGWAFLLPLLLLFFPILTLVHNPAGFAVLAIIGGAFYAIPRLLRPGHSRYLFGLVFFAWAVYGVRCTEWIPV